MNMLDEKKLQTTLDTFKYGVLNALNYAESTLNATLGDAIDDRQFSDILTEMRNDNRNSVDILVNAMEDAFVQVVEFVENKK